MCASKELLDGMAQRRAHNLCARDRKKAAKSDEYRSDAGQWRESYFTCQGELKGARERPPVAAPVWLTLTLKVVAVTSTAAAGWCVGASCPAEYAAAGFTLGLSSVLVDVLLSILPR